MKIRTRALRLLTGVILMAGLIYSALALSIKPAYAAMTCDCDQAYSDAEYACSVYTGNSLVLYFQCPVGSYYEFECTNNFTYWVYCP